jgi:hypothetical protein
VLCLLAALFAIEAKCAWYSPEGSPMVQVSAAKLQPADSPRLLAQVLSPATLPVFPEVAVLFAFALTATVVHITPAWARRSAKVSALASFSPFLFFRPPPSF